MWGGRGRGRRQGVLPTPSPQFSLSVHEVKTNRITVADFPIGTGRTTGLIRGRTSSNSYLILFDGCNATSIVLRVYLVLVPLLGRVVLNVEVGDSFRRARFSRETVPGYESLLCRVSLCCPVMVRISHSSCFVCFRNLNKRTILRAVSSRKFLHYNKSHKFNFLSSTIKQ